MKYKNYFASLLLVCLVINGCGKDDTPAPVVPPPVVPPVIPPVVVKDTFYFGADLSNVNNILDHGGLYKDGGAVQSPYKIFKDHGANLIRFRLWHNPVFTKEAYGAAGTQLYNDLMDVEKGISLAKQQGMGVLLDIHFSDSWADPSKQEIPKAWLAIRDITVLKDSVYNYTYQTLQYLNGKGLMPEMVQVGNETNCGMLFSNAPVGFPALNGCNGNWLNLGTIINSAIKAIRDVSATTTIKSKVLLHVADPKNVEWWFDNITGNGKVSDFDVVGFSYYPLWHSTMPYNQLSQNVSKFKSRYNKKVMMLETAYPWTTQFNDSYNNSFGLETPITGYPFTITGQYDLLKNMTQQVIDGGGSGIIYWEPAWITSNLKDLYGTGSPWENVSFFDYTGNAIQGINFMNFSYKR